MPSAHRSEVLSATGSAPGKVILCGEHSVVYGQPAIAVPVSDLRAQAQITADAPGRGLLLVAVDLGETVTLRAAPAGHPLATIARLTLAEIGAAAPDAMLTLHSDLPIAAGLGSGAAVSVAIARALAAFLGCELTVDTVSALAYKVEKIHHGTPSGIDNTVVAWERPVYFVKGSPPEVFSIATPFHLVIADSGLPSSTHAIVARVRRRRDVDPSRFAAPFKRMGELARQARIAIEGGDLPLLGALLNENHALLAKLDVSSPGLDRLVAAARAAGAWGAKLTGAGVGGNIIALVPCDAATRVEHALRAAGAVHVWHTTIEEQSQGRLNANDR